MACYKGAKGLDRFIQPSLRSVEPSQVVLRRYQIRVEYQRLLHLDYCLMEPPLLSVGQAEYFVGFGKFWIQAQCFLHLGHALLHMPLLQQKTPQVVARAGEGGIDTGRLAVEQHGQPQEPGLFIRRAQTVEEVRIGHDFG
jgi:hypothetical protein